MKELRPYQSLACDYIDRHLTDYKKPFVMSVCCGGGKTLIASEVAKRWGKVLILTLSAELCKQDYDELVEAGVEASVYSASLGSKEVGDITVATILSAYKHPELFDFVDVIIIDECQNVDCSRVNSTFMKLMVAINKVKRQDGGRIKVVGLTGSPWRNITRMSKRGRWITTTTLMQPLNRIPCSGGFLWGEIEEGLQTKQAMTMGYLTPVEYYSSPLDPSKLVLNSTGADYTEDSLDVWGVEAVERCFEVMVGAEKKWGVRSGIVALPFIRHCEALQALCEREGVSSTVVSSKTPQKARKEAIRAFKAGEIRWLIQSNIILVGFDSPITDTLVWCRPCTSLSLWTQAVGRVVRRSEGKQVARVLDLAGTYQTFGPVEDIRLGKENKFKTTVVGARGQISGRPLREFSFIKTKRVDKSKEER